MSERVKWGDGMVGGRNGRFWGAPIFGQNLRHRRPPTGAGPSVPGVSPKIGVSDGVSGRVSPGPFGPRAPECPLRSPGPEGPWRHPAGHSVGHPDFRGHSVRHSRGHSGPKGPRDSCRGPTVSQGKALEKTAFFHQKDAKSGRPKNSCSYHHTSHPPFDAL